MEIESPEYTIDDLRSFLDEMQNHDGQVLADRLERASRRLAEVGARVQAGRSDGHEWSNHELLAHIAGLSRYYGVLVHRVASGQISEVSLLTVAQLRDAAIDQMAAQDPAELLRMALADHERTIRTLRSASGDALRKTARIDGEVTMTAEAIARLPLISHLEAHIEQLENQLAR